jgi:hypothetical protein
MTKKKISNFLLTLREDLGRMESAWVLESKDRFC